MNSILNFLKKQLKDNKKLLNVFLVLALIVLVVVVYRYNNIKGMVSDNMQDNNYASSSNNGSMDPSTEMNTTNNASLNNNVNIQNNTNGSKPVGMSSSDEELYLEVQGIKSGPTNDKSCNKNPVVDPKELLPIDNNNEWSNIMPNNDFKNIGMLKAGQHNGLNTQISSSRNPNLQLRSEYPNPTKNVGPWNNSTIEADTMRRPLEIGSECP